MALIENICKQANDRHESPIRETTRTRATRSACDRETVFVGTSQLGLRGAAWRTVMGRGARCIHKHVPSASVGAAGAVSKHVLQPLARTRCQQTHKPISSGHIEKRIPAGHLFLVTALCHFTGLETGRPSARLPVRTCWLGPDQAAHHPRSLRGPGRAAHSGPFV